MLRKCHTGLGRTFQLAVTQAYRATGDLPMKNDQVQKLMYVVVLDPLFLVAVCMYWYVVLSTVCQLIAESFSCCGCRRALEGQHCDLFNVMSLPTCVGYSTSNSQAEGKFGTFKVNDLQGQRRVLKEFLMKLAEYVFAWNCARIYI